MMEQQSKRRVNRYRNEMLKYKKQRNIVIIAAAIAILTICNIEAAMFNKQLEAFDQLNEVVNSYKQRCSEQREQIIELTEQIKLLEYRNRQSSDVTHGTYAVQTTAYFVPTDWSLETNEDATIYQSIPLSQELQKYTWKLCEYLEMPECYETCLAIMWQETNYDADLVSETNDYGIMQVNICNLVALEEQLGITDIMAIDQNICSGVYLFALNYRQFNNINDALMGYNMGPTQASNLLHDGIYSSAYSRSVIRKTQMILQDEYDPED